MGPAVPHVRLAPGDLVLLAGVPALFAASTIAALLALPRYDGVFEVELFRFLIAILIGAAAVAPAAFLYPRARRTVFSRLWRSGNSAAILVGVVCWGLPLAAIMRAKELVDSPLAPDLGLAVHLAWWSAFGALYGLLMRSHALRTVSAASARHTD